MPLTWGALAFWSVVLGSSPVQNQIGWLRGRAYHRHYQAVGWKDMVGFPGHPSKMLSLGLCLGWLQPIRFPRLKCLIYSVPFGHGEWRLKEVFGRGITRFIWLFEGLGGQEILEANVLMVKIVRILTLAVPGE